MVEIDDTVCSLNARFRDEHIDETCLDTYFIFEGETLEDVRILYQDSELFLAFYPENVSLLRKYIPKSAKVSCSDTFLSEPDSHWGWSDHNPETCGTFLSTIKINCEDHPEICVSIKYNWSSDELELDIDVKTPTKRFYIRPFDWGGSYYDDAQPFFLEHDIDFFPMLEAYMKKFAGLPIIFKK